MNRFHFASVLFVAVSLVSSFAGAVEDKPKYGPNITLLSQSHEYIQKHTAPDYWALSPYYLPQQDGRSCSLASVTMVVNAARQAFPLKASEKLATQKELLGKTNDPAWSKDLGDGGRGVTLDELKTFVVEALKTYGVSNATAEAYRFDSTAEGLHKLRQILATNEKTAQDFVIANFDQGVFTGDETAGHIAPIAAYDAQKKRVLVMDPDREWYEPYWVSDEVFLKGMNTADSTSAKSRGLVWVKIGPR
jgi:hypothetical protein